MDTQKNYKEFLRAVKFLFISISAGLIDFGSCTLCFSVIGLDFIPSLLISVSLSVLWNFTINRKYTFKSANNIKIAMLLVFGFYAVFTPVSIIIGDNAVNNGANKYLVKGITMIANFVLEFLFTRLVVYRNSCDTAKSKTDEE